MMVKYKDASHAFLHPVLTQRWDCLRERETETETERERDRDRERQRQRQTETDRKRETEDQCVSEKSEESNAPVGMTASWCTNHFVTYLSRIYFTSANLRVPHCCAMVDRCSITRMQKGSVATMASPSTK